MKISEAAKKKVIDLLTENNAPILRFGLKGGGCSGMQYMFNLEQEVDQDDIIYSLDETHKVVVDPFSMSYLEEAELDYKKDLTSENFTVHNPSAKTQCGCGSSFSID